MSRSSTGGMPRHALVGAAMLVIGSIMVAAFGRALSLNRTFVIPAVHGTRLVSVHGNQTVQ